jgi:hypoxanthine-DNA glycosylase
VIADSGPARAGTAPGRVESFAPLWSPAARILVLGSMPGRASLAAAEYYAHPRNLFWPLVGTALGIDPSTPYPERCAGLVARGLALWDVCRSCERPGSLDAAIREVEPNDLAGLVARLPELRAVACNGQKAHELLHRHLLRPRPDALGGRPVLRLPSTSPANASVPAADKVRAWRRALHGAGIDLG